MIATAAAATNGFMPDEVELADMARKEERKPKRRKDQLANGTIKEDEMQRVALLITRNVYIYKPVQLMRQ